MKKVWLHTWIVSVLMAGMGMVISPLAMSAFDPIFHPADANKDWRISMSEAISCLSLWQSGTINISTALRAAHIWSNGELYHYDPSYPPPECWVVGPDIPEGEGEPGEGEEETWTVMLADDVPLTMVRISGGTFLMGRNPDEQDSYTREDPQHSVTVSDFWMGKYEITKAQWYAVMGTTPWASRSYIIEHPDSPAVYISWTMAKSFITALNTLTGESFRLPSEAEWEYACRAGTTTRFYWGDDPESTIINDYAWWTGNAWNAKERYAHIVGQKRPNAWGLYDMCGNAMEKCEDDWHDSYAGAPEDGIAWINSPRASSRVVRGGHVGGSSLGCRSAYRASNTLYVSDAPTGFRLVRP